VTELRDKYVGKRVLIYLEQDKPPDDGVVIRYEHSDQEGPHLVIGLLKQPVWLVNPTARWHLKHV